MKQVYIVQGDFGLYEWRCAIKGSFY